MSNRAAKYELLYKSLKKNFKPIPEVGERTVLEHLIYACCLEDARADQADEAFAKLQQAYFDWNEVRVTTVIELGEALNSLPNATQAGHRIKRCLQSLFETRYQYDLEDMKKANLGKATDELTAWKGVTPFILNYVSQNALGGHAIPADAITLDVLVQADVITASEAEKKSLPGVERAISKSKGFEFASLLHQFAIEFQQNPKSANALAVFKELGVVPKAKPAEKPVAAKETKAKPAPQTPVAEPTPAPVKGKVAPAETVSPEPSGGKKNDKSTAAPAKAKDAVPAKAPLKAEVEKAANKKKAEPAPADAKKAAAKKEPPAKASDKPAVKKPADKAPAAKPTAKKPEAKSEAKPADAKKAPKPAPAKPAAEAKAKAPSKPAADKQATNVKITKKKPR